MWILAPDLHNYLTLITLIMSTTTSTTDTLVPASGLVVQNPGPDGGTPLFCLFTQDWITLQTFIVQALQLPIALGQFEDKYGSFSDESAIKDCIAAMANVQGLSNDFGDPTALVKEIASNPAVLQGDTAPDQLYLHIVWFATKLYQTATTFNQTLGQFMELLNATPADQRMALVTEILTGDGGLQSSAVSMGTLANALNQKMANFNLKLAPSVDEMSDYTSKSSKFYQDVEAAITQDTTDIDTFQKEADDTYKLWRDLTISATTVSIGLMVVTGGMAWPLSAVAAGVLGSQAKKARDAYDAAVEHVNAARADEQKKIRLKADLNGFNVQMAPVTQAAQNFQTTLAKVEGVWLTIANDLAYIAKTFTPDQFENLPVWKEASKLDLATQDWKIIAQKADEYTANSLVTYHIQDFTAPLPPDPSLN
jgi:hypothetical protein